MVKKTKPIILILVTLIAVSLVGLAIGSYIFQQERLKVIVLTVELENVKVEFRRTMTRLAENRNKINELNERLDAANAQIKELDDTLELARVERREFYSKIRNLQLQIQEHKKIRKELEARRNQSHEEINKLKALLQASKVELKSRSKQEVELGKVVVEQKDIDLTQSQYTSVLEGTVLVVNNDYNFVVINLGTKDGVEINDIFSVYNNGSHIGDIKVDRTQEIMSACLFISKELKGKISEGDKVIRE